MKAKWPGTALVDDLAIHIDQVNAIRPAGVGTLDGVVESVYHRRKLYPQLAHAAASKRTSLFFALGAREHHVLADVALHLPHVARMRLHNVHDEKADAI